MKLQVETIWKGYVAIRDKYYDEAIAKHLDLVLIYRAKKMTIPADKVAQKAAFKSQKPFVDRYSKAKHYLYYFTWKEDKPLEIKQQTLL